MTEPGPDDLAAYRRGTLPPARFAAVDAWLAQLPESEVERLLAAGDAGAPPLALPETPAAAFAPVEPRPRFAAGAELGRGGMGRVEELHDRALGRTVALKRLRARAPDEPLEAFLLRQEAFRREAALTAGLEHPGIVPVHDVGSVDGLPAFTMPRLDGEPLGAWIARRREGGGLGTAALVEVLLRAAEAVGFAHSRGVVHRDLAPANVLVGGFGTVQVLDWGLAARSGEAAVAAVGTPGWTAPEQRGPGPVDARQDVWALGALLAALLTGDEPAAARLDGPGIPAGLAALARRCLDPDPARRCRDGGEVAAELRRWLDQGLTEAQGLRPWERAWLRLRRSPRLRTAIAVALALGLLAATAWAWERQRRLAAAGAQVAELARVDLDRPEAVAVALAALDALRAAHPGLEAAERLDARLRAARDLDLRRRHQAEVRAGLEQLVRGFRLHGWRGDQAPRWQAALARAGLELTAAAHARDAAALAGHPDAGILAEALAFLWLGRAEGGARAPDPLPARLLADAGPGPGWKALGTLLLRTRFAAHDPVFDPFCDDCSAALADPASVGAALAVFGPDPRLAAAARRALDGDPGAFWPLLALARHALREGDAAAVERHALVASGVEPQSLFPQLYLAYAALLRRDREALARAAGAGLAASPEHGELLALAAVALAWEGATDRAASLAARIGGDHLSYHRQHRVGHPMERSVQALVEAGVPLPAGAPRLGPLAPCH